MLLLVVVVVVMLSLSGLTYVSLLSTEHKAVHVAGDELQAEHLVGSGEETLKAFLALPYTQQQELGGWVDNPDRFRGVLVFGSSRLGVRGRFSIVSPLQEGDEVTAIRFGLQNESARLNLGVLPEWERARPGAGREALMRLPGMTEAAAEAILDWVDADADARPQGAEEAYYMSLHAPYAPRNAPPTSLEELLLVRGVTRAMLFGADKDCNYLIDESEAIQAQSSAQMPESRLSGDDAQPWAPLLTVASAERNVDPQGRPRIDLNERDLGKLHQRLSAVLPEPWPRFIIAYRQQGPSKSPSETADPDAEIPLDLANPGKVRIRSVLDLVGVQVSIPREKDEKPLVIPSPLANDPVALRDALPTLLDFTTTIRSPIVRGRVNVDLAPEAVLRGIPTMEDGMISRIVAAREAPAGQGDPGRRHALWLLTDGLVDLEQMKTLLHYVTGGGDVYRAQIVGFFDQPGPSARAEVVIDATVTPPRQVYWKNLRDLGPGYPLDALGAQFPTEMQAATVWQRDKF